jgi:D-3-phosphoglycerate dehydrogenase
MRHGTYLINNARASMVDIESLRVALKSGQLAGAALDTFDPEPPVAGDELLAMPNVTVTPHIAGASRFVATFAAERLAEEVERFLQQGAVKARVA